MATKTAKDDAVGRHNPVKTALNRYQYFDVKRSVVKRLTVPFSDIGGAI
jgi:hypothetical protein